jgi:hypothetical protein
VTDHLDTTGAVSTLMRAQIEHEFQLAHKPKLERYEKALNGIATCATQCGCCRMHVQIALDALNDKLPTKNPL